MFTVYRLTLSAPGKPDRHYVGCTKRFRARENEHRSMLKKGAHFNRDLQASYDAETAISIMVLAEANSHQVGVDLESQWTNILRAKGDIVLNRRLDAGSNRGLRHSDRTRAAITSALSGRNTRSPEAIASTNEKLKGRSKPEQVIEASQRGLAIWRSDPKNVESVARQQARLSDEQVRAIRASSLTYARLSGLFGVAPSVICRIRQIKSYRWVS